jgi:hypothetical protein
MMGAFFNHTLAKLPLAVLVCGMAAFADIDCTVADLSALSSSDSAAVVNYCRYGIVNTSAGLAVYTHPDTTPAQRKYAYPNSLFYLYSLKDDSLSTVEKCSANTDDSLNCRNAASDSVFILRNGTAVNSGAKDSVVNVSISAAYPLYNAAIGVLTTPEASPEIARYYNFYLPEIRYLDSAGNSITKESALNAEVGRSVKITVQAIVPIGPKAGKVDTTLDSATIGSAARFYVSSPEGLTVLTAGGTALPYDANGEYVKFIAGEASFTVTAKSAVNGGSFSLSGVQNHKADSTAWFVTSLFPGDLNFTYPDMPSLDSAWILDSDGDGAGDSIAAWFSGKTSGVSLDSFFYNWPNGGAFTKYSGDHTFNGSELSLSDVRTAIPADSGRGDLKVNLTAESGAAGVLTTALADKIGPVIQAVTLVKGQSGEKDTLVIKFNKDLDTSFSSGAAFILQNGTKNGIAVNVNSVAKKGDMWTFAVDSGTVAVGDSLSIAVNGGIAAADGNEVSSNNQPVRVTNSGRIYLSNGNNAFFDSDGDGKMDSVTVGFESAITQDELNASDLRFYWLDSAGNTLEIIPDASDLVLSADGKKASYKLSEKWESKVKDDLTSIDDPDAYGYAKMRTTIVINGESKDTVSFLKMNDRIAPVISSAFISPESSTEARPDKLVVTFSEAIDVDAIKSADQYLKFFVNGEWINYDLGNAVWSSDGKTLTAYVAQGEDLLGRANPGDSVKIGNIADGIQDAYGNSAQSNTPSVFLEGDPRVVMKTSSMVAYDRNVLSTGGASFTERFVSPDSSIAKERDKSLGVLLNIAFATIFDDSTGDSLDLNRIGLKWSMDVFTNIGGYVAGSSGTILCNDKDFGGNCFENEKNLYLRWNLRSDDGRKAGVGVYLAKFKLKVYGEKKSYTYEKIFKWGVHGGKDGLSLD